MEAAVKQTSPALVGKDEIFDALLLLQDCDQDAANVLRAWIEAHYLLQDGPLEIRELLLRAAERTGTQAARLQECAMVFERMARGIYEAGTAE